MPRNAVAREKWFGIVCTLAALAVACGDDRVVAGDSGTMPAPDAAQDAQIDDAALDGGNDGSMEPPSGLDGGVLDNLMEEYCVLRIAAQCDGPEDCNGGQCCARFQPNEVSFTSMECADACDWQQTFPLCHAGQRCTVDDQTVCRTSRLIPGEFIGVCAPRLARSRAPTGTEVEGAIECGDDECIVGQEQCCIREGFNLKRFQSIPLEPYCAPIGEPCDCMDADNPPPDAGPSDDDAGL